MVSGEKATMKDFAKTRMKVRVLFVAVVVIVASVVIAGWMLRYDLLTYKAYTDKDRYAPGESVNVTAKFTNLGFASVALTFGTSAMARFSVYSDDGSFVCEIPVFALAMITHVNLGPGKSVAFGAYWDQSDDLNHTQVPYPGDYHIKARTLSHEFHAEVTTATFTISVD